LRKQRDACHQMQDPRVDMAQSFTSKCSDDIGRSRTSPWERYNNHNNHHNSDKIV